jgi:hypothetical protein
MRRCQRCYCLQVPAKRPTPKKPAKRAVKKPAKKAASTSGDVIAWTPVLRAKTYATRTRPNPRHLTGGIYSGPMWVPEKVPYPYDLELAWKEALGRTWSLAEWAQPPNSIPVGYPNATPELAALARRALDAFGKRLDVLDADVEAAMLALELRPAWLGMPLWIAMHGVAFATRVMVTASRWRNNEGSTGKHREQGLYLIEDGIGAGREIFEHSTAWRILRGVIAIASETDYAEARAIADAARRTLQAEAHAAVAFLFPDEPWCKDAVTALIKADNDDAWESWQMLMATAEAKDAIRIARLNYPMDISFAMTMLAKHGTKVIPIIAAAFDTFAMQMRFAVLGDTLAMIRTREALEAFVPMLGISAVKGALARAFKAQPEIGKKLLAKPAKKTDKAGKAAAALLAKL